MDNIKLAEDTIKHLKDFIEIEKLNKKTITEKAKYELKELSKIMINVCENNIKEIKGE
jgi:hypothetical protein